MSGTRSVTGEPERSPEKTPKCPRRIFRGIGLIAVDCDLKMRRRVCLRQLKNSEKISPPLLLFCGKSDQVSLSVVSFKKQRGFIL
jgi:hypothetical protein